MSANLLSLFQTALGGDFARLAGQFLGESVPSTRSALTSLVPAALGSVAQKGATPRARRACSRSSTARTRHDRVRQHRGNVRLRQQRDELVDEARHIVAGAGALRRQGRRTGQRARQRRRHQELVGDEPDRDDRALIFTFLKKYVSQNNLSAGSLSSLLNGQGEFLSKLLDSRLTGALGYANPAAMLSGLVAQRSIPPNAPARPWRPAQVRPRALRPRQRPPPSPADALAAVADRRGDPARAVEHVRGPADAPASAPAPKAAATPARPAPAPVAAAGFPFKVYFDTGSAAVGPVSGATIAAAAEAIRKDAVRVALTGTPTRPATWRRTRSSPRTARRPCVTPQGRGIAESGIELRPPVFVEVGTSGPDQEARASRSTSSRRGKPARDRMSEAVLATASLLWAEGRERRPVACCRTVAERRACPD